MITAQKISRIIVLLGLVVSTSESSKARLIEQVSTQISSQISNKGISKVHKVTIHGKRLSEEQKRIFDIEQRNKLTIEHFEKNSIKHAHENSNKAETSTSNNKLIKLSAKTT
jgi:hypothetical protein